MTFKTGALVMLLGNGVVNRHCKPFVGTPRILGWRVPPGYLGAPPNTWFFDPPLFSSDGIEIGWDEPRMKLIDPGTGTDEMLLIAGKPEARTPEAV